MPINLDAIGIQTVVPTLTETLDVSAKVDVAVLTDFEGKFVKAHGFDPKNEVAIKGKGDLPAGLVLGSDGGDDLGEIGQIANGVTIVDSTKEVENNESWNAWEATAKNFPNAE